MMNFILFFLNTWVSVLLQIKLFSLKKFKFYFPTSFSLECGQNFHYMHCLLENNAGLKNFHRIFQDFTECVGFCDEISCDSFRKFSTERHINVPWLAKTVTFIHWYRLFYFRYDLDDPFDIFRNRTMLVGLCEKISCDSFCTNWFFSTLFQRIIIFQDV